MNTYLYLNFIMTIGVLFLSDVLGWMTISRIRKRAWIQIRTASALMVAVIKTITITIYLETIDGGTIFPVVAGFALFNLINPYYLHTAGLAMGNSGGHVRKSMQYKSLVYFSLCLITVGGGLHYNLTGSVPWSIGITTFVFLYVLLMIPPRVLIRSQQMLYKYRMFGA